MWILLGLVVVFIGILASMIYLSDEIGFVITIPKRLISVLRFGYNQLFHILSIVLLILGILIVINYYKFDLNPSSTKSVQSVVSIETLGSIGHKNVMGTIY